MTAAILSTSPLLQATCEAQAATDVTLLCAARVWTMAGDPISNGCVQIADGRVARVGQRSDFDTSLPGVVDRPNGEIIPGIIDVHSHFTLRGDPRGAGEANERSRSFAPDLDILDAFDPYDPSVAHARSGGVTTALVTPGSIGVVSGRSALVKTTAPPLSQMVMRTPAGVKGTSWRPETYDVFDHWLGEARAAQARPSSDTAIAIKVGEQLLRREIPLVIHGGYPGGEIEPVLAIADKYALRLIIYHCESCDENYEELVARKIPIVVGPRIMYWNRGRETNLASFLMSKGLLVALASDASSGESRYLMDDAGLALHYGLTEKQALEAITINAARIFHADDRIGSLTPGKDADVVVLSGPVFRARTHVDLVMIGGRVWYER
ncbi:MAG: amidohydrolase family protein [Gemmatimonadaceae bacterium]